MKNPEILAPVGGPEQLVAAVRAGADAVYLGTRGLNARRGAVNFDADELRDAVAYCHARGVAVHVTVNTIVTDGELAAAEREARDVAASGADAAIIQDLAVLRVFRACCPDVAAHASTQMEIHNAAGVRECARLGFRRVVLARELSLDEIRTVSAAAREAGIEVECFVHGAQCVSVSGMCYLSSLIGGRSGNRGLCAQPCRLECECGGRGHALSLKDMSLISRIGELRDAGVASCKIEGRMKRPEYVAAAVDACRAALAGGIPDMETLAAVFSRGGFTDGYFAGRRTGEMFGYRTKEDVEAASGVLGRLAGLYRAERQSVPVSMRLTARAGAPARLAVSDGTNAVEAVGEPPLPSDRAPDAAALADRLRKTGGTPFLAGGVEVDAPDACMLPASACNALRRDALARLLAARETPTPRAFTPFADAEDVLARDAGALPPPPAPARREVRHRFETADQLFDTDADRVILPIETVADAPILIDRFGARLIAELPALVFPDAEPALVRSLARLRELGLTDVTADNLGALALARDAGLTVHGGAGLNILNASALEVYARLGLADAVVSFELDWRSMRELAGGIRRGAVVYGRLPLMRFRACPARGADGCGACDGRPSVTDRKGETLPILCHERRWSTLLNCVPLYTPDKGDPPADFDVLYFTTETRSEAKRIAELAKRQAAPDFRRTGGLYFRDLL